MDPKIIGILIGFVFLVILAIFLYIRKKETEEYTQSESKLFLSNLSNTIYNVIDDYLTIDNLKKILDKHYLDDFADSENYIINIIVNDLYDKLYDFILGELEDMAEKDVISKAVYKFIKKNKDVPDSVTYNFLNHIIESDQVKYEIESISTKYWNEYSEELDKLEDKYSNVSSDEYIEDLESEPDFKPEEVEDEIDESNLNPPTDDEIPFDESIDEVLEDGEEEVTYFFDSNGRKRDKKTGRYTK